MLIETRTGKQEIPPRPTAKKKTKVKKGKTKAIPKKRKRKPEVSDDDEESDLESSKSESDGLELKTKKRRKWVHIEELSNSDSDGLKVKKKCKKHSAAKRVEQELDVVETMVPEVAELVVNNQADEEEVSINLIEKCILHSQNGRMTGLMTTNEGMTFKKNQ